MLSAQLLPESPELVQKVMKRVHARERAMLDRELREVNSWSGHGIRRVRMPDGTHMSFRIPRNSYHFWIRKLGMECWQDPGFVHEFLRDNPQCRVHSEAAQVRILSGWTPGPAAQAYRRLRDSDKAAATPTAPPTRQGLIVPPRYATAQ